MMAEDAPPMREAAEAKAARKAASNVARSQADAALESTGASEPAEEVSSAVTPPGGRRRYSTRSAARAGTVDAAQGQQQEAQQERAAAATPEMPAVADRRLSLRRLRTPMQMAHSAAAQAAAAGTPQGQQLPAAGVPVAQDASPQLTESPSALAAAAAAAGARTLRPSTLKKARQSVGTPLPAGNENSSKNKTPEAGGGGKEGRRSATPQLSPTEQGIRSALRRSARKARTDGATPS